MIHVVLDETAMVAAGTGNIKASRLIHFAMSDPTWGAAHARYAAQPTPELPNGAFVATADPVHQVRLIDLTP